MTSPTKRRRVEKVSVAQAVKFAVDATVLVPKDNTLIALFLAANHELFNTFIKRHTAHVPVTSQIEELKEQVRRDRWENTFICRSTLDHADDLINSNTMLRVTSHQGTKHARPVLVGTAIEVVVVNGPRLTLSFDPGSKCFTFDPYILQHKVDIHLPVLQTLILCWKQTLHKDMTKSLLAHILTFVRGKQKRK
jgi:hypothetical protein